MKKSRKPTQVPPSLKSIDIKAILRRRGIYEVRQWNRNAKEAALPIARQIINNRKIIRPSKTVSRRHTIYSDEEVHEYWVKQIQIVEVLEQRFEKKVEQFIVKVKDGFLNHLDHEISNRKSIVKAKDYFDDNEDDLVVQAQLDFGSILLDQANVSGQEAYKLIGAHEIYTPQAIKEIVSTNIERFTRSMLDTDRQTMVNIITHGLDAGKSVPEIRSQIQADFDNISKSQAQRITRTEVLRASNQGTLDAYDQSGVVEGKQWLTAGADDECADYEGEIVGLDGGFYGSDSEFADGDPPLHPNCRCTILPVLENGYNPATGIFEDERGGISIDDEPVEAYHGEGHNLHNAQSAMLGNAFYLSREKSVAAEFGDVAKLELPFADNKILKINSTEQYDNFVKAALTKALAENKSLETSVALPAYIQSLGYKAAEIAPSVDPLGGIGVVDKKAITAIKRQLKNPKSYARRIEELEAQIDKRTKDYRELKQQRADDATYIKRLEKYLGVEDD